MKGEDLTVLEQTTHLTQKRSYSRLPSKSHWKKITSGVKFAKQQSALLQNNKVWKKILPFFQLQRTTPRLPHSQNNFRRKWDLIYPLQREIYKTQHSSNANAYLLNILVRSETLCHVSHSIEPITHTCPIYTNGYDSLNQWSMVRLVPIEMMSFQWVYWLICISLRGLRLFFHIPCVFFVL